MDLQESWEVFQIPLDNHFVASRTAHRSVRVLIAPACSFRNTIPSQGENITYNVFFKSEILLIQHSIPEGLQMWYKGIGPC